MSRRGEGGGPKTLGELLRGALSNRDPLADLLTKGPQAPIRPVAPSSSANSAPPPRTTSEILAPEELAPVVAHMELRHLEAERIAKRAEELAAQRAQAEEDARRRREADEEAELRAVLEQRPRGPNLPPHKRTSPRLYVQEADLDDLIPDGWGAAPEFDLDAARLGERIGMSPAEVKLLILLEWFHGLRPSRSHSWRGTGGGLQASPAWIARKLGLSERWVQILAVRLDPYGAWRRDLARVRLTNRKRKARGLPPEPEPARPEGGTSYIQRHTRMRDYKALTADLPPGERLPKWMDRRGQLHELVDLTGVLLPTALGCRVLRRRAERRHRLRPGKTPKLRRSVMQEDLYRRLSPIYRRLRARLAPAPQMEITPNNVQRDQSYRYSAPSYAEQVSILASLSDTGPPGEDVRPPPDGGGRDLRPPTAEIRTSGAPPDTLPVKLSGLGCPPAPAPISPLGAPDGPARPPRTRSEALKAWGDKLTARAAARKARS